MSRIEPFRSPLLLPRELPFKDPRERRFYYCYRRSGQLIVDPLGLGNTQLIADLGVTPLGFWDVRQHLTVSGGAASSLADVKGDGTYGPAFVQATGANQPVWDGTTLNFDGSSDFMLTAAAITGASLAAPITDVMVAAVPDVSGRVAASLGALDNSHFLELLVVSGRLLRAASDPTGAGAQLASSFTAGVIIVAFAAITGAGVGSSIEAPNIAKATSAAPSTAEPSGDRFAALGANMLGTANVAIKFRARLILPGLYTAGQKSTILTWAETYHAAAAQ